MIVIAFEDRPPPLAMGADEPNRPGHVALLEGLSAFGAIDRLQSHGERDEIAVRRKGVVQPLGNIAEERIYGTRPGEERRIPLPPDAPLDGPGDEQAEVASWTGPRSEYVGDGRAFHHRP